MPKLKENKSYQRKARATIKIIVQVHLPQTSCSRSWSTVQGLHHAKSCWRASIMIICCCMCSTVVVRQVVRTRIQAAVMVMRLVYVVVDNHQRFWRLPTVHHWHVSSWLWRFYVPPSAAALLLLSFLNWSVNYRILCRLSQLIVTIATM